MIYIVLSYWLWFFGMAGFGLLVLPLFFSEKNSIHFHGLLMATVTGSIFSALLAMVLSYFGLLKKDYAWLWWLILCIGFFIFLWKLTKEKFSLANGRFLLRNSTILERLILLSFLFYFFTRGITALLPQNHGDPLLYNLLGPRQWLLQGKITLVENLPNTLIANYWEYIYIWPQILFSHLNTLDSLIYAQIFSQLTHLFLGMGGAIFLLVAIFRLYGFNGNKLFLIAWAAALTKSIQWTASIAKNDWGVLFWVLAGLYCIEYWRRNRFSSYLWAGGVFWGFAMVAKFNALLLILPAIIVYGIYFRSKKFFYLPIIMLIAATPILLRNWMATNNPFYPMFANIIPTLWISDTWRDFIGQGQPSYKSFSPAILWQRFIEIMREGFAPASFLFSILFLPLATVRKDWQRLTPIPHIVLFSIILLCTVVGSNQEIRYLGAILLLQGVLGLLIWVNLLEKYLSKKYHIAIQALILAVVLASSRIPLHIYWKFPKMNWGENAVFEHTAADSKTWLRDNAKPNELIIMIADNEAYYLSGLLVTIVTERPDLDSATRQTKTIRDFFQAIRRVAPNAKYILEGREEYGLKIRFPNDSDLANVEKAIVYQGKTSRVLDLSKINLGN